MPIRIVIVLIPIVLSSPEKALWISGSFYRIINPSSPPAAAIMLPAVCLAAAAVELLVVTLLVSVISVEIVLAALSLLVLVLTKVDTEGLELGGAELLDGAEEEV
jgi:hypothetical protein